MATYYGKKYRLLEIKHLFKEFILSYKIALKSKTTGRPKTSRPVYIAMVDGTAVHGGMCDRFKGIITLYAYCKHSGVPFRIKYTFPFRLEDYLSPAAYDWILKENEYTDNPRYIRILYMRKEYLARRLMKLKTNKQVHFYGNRDSLQYINDAYNSCHGETENDMKWGELFRELFKPNSVLEERIKSIKKDLGNNYYAAVFRFQNLLGDFKEYNYKPISDRNAVEELIEKCLNAIRNLRTIHDKCPLLVTSDSRIFLKRASQIDGVHIIPGTLTHMDISKSDIQENVYDSYMKSFLDFYILSDSQKIYRIGTSYMYPSEFPVYAAKVNNIPFESITI